MPNGTLGAILTVVMALSGAAGLGGILAAVRGWRTDRWANEGTLVERLNADSQQQGLRADGQERARRAWEDQAGRYRRQLILHLPAGVEPDDTVWLTGTAHLEQPAQPAVPLIAPPLLQQPAPALPQPEQPPVPPVGPTP